MWESHEHTATCTVDDCDKPLRARGMCGMHYERLRRHGSLDASPRQRRRQKPRRAKLRTREGYVLVYAPDDPAAQATGYILEHRKVIAEALGRALLADETVHHRNGRRDDNRPENLELWVSRHGRGGRVEDVLAWAREIVARYS